MNSILVKDVLLDGKLTDVLTEGGKIVQAAPGIQPAAEPAETIYADGKLAILPPFYNGHTHAAMSLLRGYADDHDLFDWLQNYIWPLEGKMVQRDIYAGTRLACLEMIKTGTVFFNDMYWFQPESVRAAEEMGMRADIGHAAMLPMASADQIAANEDLLTMAHSGRIRVSMAPHAIYTVAAEKYRAMAERAKQDNMPMTTHLAETESEFNDCLKNHGMTPTAYLESLGFLTPKTTLAHSVWMTEADYEIIARTGAVLVHNPVSNCKLASGTFNYAAAKAAGCRIILGTDGNASNNNLSMPEELKTATLLAKNKSGDPKTLPAREAFDLATVKAAEAFGVNAGIEAGKAADFMLVDVNHYTLTPGFNLISDMVYSADPECIRTVVCDGRILMHDRKVPGEDEIIAEAREYAVRWR